jgi:TPR repeat protein
MSDNVEYLRTKCPRCQTTIEFPKNGIGQQVPCPNCNWIVTLKKPFPKTACAIALLCGVCVVAGAVAVTRSKPNSNTAQSNTARANKGQRTETIQRTEQQAQSIQDTDPILIAAKSGDPAAQYQVASNYLIQQNYTEAIKWARKSAEQGNAAGEGMLADSFHWGLGVARNSAEAAKWWRKAADQGNANAQVNLGNLYDLGEGVAQDHTEAVTWYRKAADHGNVTGQNNLGLSYSKGSGVAQDYMEAVKWFRKAAGQGDADALYDLGLCFEKGYGVGWNLNDAVRWYRKAADQGQVEAEFAIAYAYSRGSGVPTDDLEAYKWFQLALKQQFDGPTDYREQMVVECAKVKKALRPEQIQEAERAVAAFIPGQPVREPPSESTETISFTDPAGVSPGWATFQSQFEIQIHRILNGERVIEEGKLYSTQIDDSQKEPLYFEVSVKNVGCEYETSVYGMRFKLIDESGYSYSDIMPRDHINGKIAIGTHVGGGIAFALNKGAKPEKLIFDTGLVRTLGAAAALPVGSPLDEYHRDAAFGVGTKILGEADLKHVSLFQSNLWVGWGSVLEK